MVFGSVPLEHDPGAGKPEGQHIRGRGEVRQADDRLTAELRREIGPEQAHDASRLGRACRASHPTTTPPPAPPR